MPDGCVLILDEAYIQFAPESAIFPMDTGSLKVVRMRTFFKAHRMAGARVGYAVANADIVPPLDRCIRVTIGTAGQRRLFAERFRDACSVLDGAA